MKAETGASPSETIGPPQVTAPEPIVAAEPTEDDIRRRAYQRYLERGGSHGQDFEDWLHAERELKARNADSGDRGSGR
jgi:hypothetical protein